MMNAMMSGLGSWLRVLSLGVAALVLAACGPSEPQGPSAEEMAEIAEHALTLMPSDPALAEVYEYSCYSCHSNPDSGAPMTGNGHAWGPRMDKGLDVLLSNTINGYKGMPPMGMCMDCSAEQFEALILFMAKGEG